MNCNGQASGHKFVPLLKTGSDVLLTQQIAEQLDHFVVKERKNVIYKIDSHFHLLILSVRQI